MAEQILPAELPAAASVVPGAAIVGQNSATVEKFTPLQIVDAARPLASQAEAEAGINDSKMMTPLKVAQAILAQVMTVFALATGSTLIGWIQSGTGAVLRTIRDKLRDNVSVKDFGAIGDGTADDTAAIQAAANKGGRIYFPPGTYKTTAPITITVAAEFYGAEWTSVVAPNFAAGNVFSITGPVSGDAGVTIRGLVFKGSVPRSSGAYIQTSGVNYINIDRCKFVAGFVGVRYTGAGATGFYITNCNFSYNTNINILIDPSTGGVDQIIENVWILGPSNITNSVAGILVTSTGDLTLRHVNTVWAGNGLHIAPTGGVRIQLMAVSQSFFDSGTGYGIYCATNGGNVDSLKISDVWCATNQGGGVFLGATGAGQIRQADIVNTVSANNSLDGFRLQANTSNVTLTGCAAGQNVQNGCLIDANTNLFRIVNSTFGATGEFAANAGFGVVVVAGTSNNYIISLNRVAGNGSGQISDGGSGVNKVVASNV